MLITEEDIARHNTLSAITSTRISVSQLWIRYIATRIGEHNDQVTGDINVPLASCVNHNMIASLVDNKKWLHR